MADAASAPISGLAFKKGATGSRWPGGIMVTMYLLLVCCVVSIGLF
jgi:hypothetical protein